jgi:FkbM family methyltransferase
MDQRHAKKVLWPFNVIETVLARVSRQRILRKRLPAGFERRRLYVTPESYRRYWWKSLGSIHGDLLEVIATLVHAGSSFWDIGANVGVLTFAAAVKASRGGFVLAVDADPYLIDLLKRSRSLRCAAEAPVDLLNVAVSDCVGSAQFSISNYRRAASSLEGFGRFTNGGTMHTVRTVTLDWMLEQFRAPAVLKIDVEGAEELVLQGATRLLSETRPVILCEVGRESSAEVGRILQTNRYTCYDLRKFASVRAPLTVLIDDIVAIPN